MDGKGKMQVFGFDSRVHGLLVNFQETKESLAMSNCEVKRVRKSEGLRLQCRMSAGGIITCRRDARGINGNLMTVK